MADGDSLCVGGYGGKELLGDLTLHEEAGVGRAHLTLVEEDRIAGPRCADVQVADVGQDDVGLLPPHSREAFSCWSVRRRPAAACRPSLIL
jgi:hypothetical protein